MRPFPITFPIIGVAAALGCGGAMRRPDASTAQTDAIDTPSGHAEVAEKPDTLFGYETQRVYTTKETCETATNVRIACDYFPTPLTLTVNEGQPDLVTATPLSGKCGVATCPMHAKSCRSLTVNPAVPYQGGFRPGDTCELLVQNSEGRVMVVQAETFLGNTFSTCCGARPAPPYPGVWVTVEFIYFKMNPPTLEAFVDPNDNDGGTSDAAAPIQRD
jgi:hypothetical protein